jgi:hypothetical protein
MMRMREIAIGAVLTGLLAGGVLLTMPSPEPLHLALPAPKAASAPVTLPVAHAPTASAPSAPQQPANSWRDLHAKFVRAPNLRVFFYEAMRHPEEGAFYYAMNTVQTCKIAMEAAPDQSPAQRAAAKELRQRCDFTPQGLEDARRELYAARHLDLGQDAQLGSMFDYLAADGVDGRAAILRAAFEQGNPEVIGALVAHAVEGSLPAPGPGELDSTARGVTYGAVLLACRLGADCGAGALRTLELCVRQGWCADSVPAALEQGLGEHFAALDQVASKALRAAVLPRP